MAHLDVVSYLAQYGWAGVFLWLLLIETSLGVLVLFQKHRVTRLKEALSCLGGQSLLGKN